MTVEKLVESEYRDLVAVTDGKSPLDAFPLLRSGLIEPITQTNLQDGIIYRLTSEGRRHYTQFRERVSADNAHLQ